MVIAKFPAGIPGNFDEFWTKMFFHAKFRSVIILCNLISEIHIGRPLGRDILLDQNENNHQVTVTRHWSACISKFNAFFNFNQLI